jgi:hypothetical protein
MYKKLFGGNLLWVVGLAALETAMAFALGESNQFAWKGIAISMIAIFIFAVPCLNPQWREKSGCLPFLLFIAVIFGSFASLPGLLGPLMGNTQSTIEQRDNAEIYRELAVNKFRNRMVSEIKGIINSYQGITLPDTPTEIRKKTFIVPFISDLPSNVFPLTFHCDDSLSIPEFMSYPNEPLTVFYVAIHNAANGGDYEVGHYGLFGPNAYEVCFDVYCIEWPERKPVAKRSIWSHPAEKHLDTHLKVWGNEDDVNKWLDEISKKPGARK